MEQKRVYLDNAATTRTDPDVVEAMMPYFTDTYAVASSEFSHTPGIQAREGLDNAREIIAKKLNASPEEIVFTSGGTEANNLALKGSAQAASGKKNHIVCSRVEHNSVLHTCHWLEEQGYKLTWLDTDEEGFVDLNQLEKSIGDKTFLVSVQHGNQEVGTVQDIETIGRICKEKGVLFHTDAAQSFTQLEIDVNRMNADIVTLSSHKIHGPKGVGALVVRKGTPLKKILHGGYSEFDMRPGTENVAGAVGFGKAVELSKPEHITHIRSLQKHLLESLKNKIDGVILNGPEDLNRRLPWNVNVSFDLIEGESVVLHLDMKGISVITGSACFSRSLEPSYVMMAMGFTHERAHGSIRFTMSRFNEMEEIDYVVESCKEVVEALRKISPLKNKE
jgi:cysteine desulfurase